MLPKTYPSSKFRCGASVESSANAVTRAMPPPIMACSHIQQQEHHSGLEKYQVPPGHQIQDDVHFAEEEQRVDQQHRHIGAAVWVSNQRREAAAHSALKRTPRRRPWRSSVSFNHLDKQQSYCWKERRTNELQTLLIQATLSPLFTCRQQS